MSLNSVNTNMGAMVALQSLNRTNSQMAATQKRISTGYKVADAEDDGAAFAVAQRIRGDVGALTAVNDQLGGVKGILSTTNSSLTNISNTMNKMKELLVNLSNGNVTGQQRAQYTSEYYTQLKSVKGFFQDSSYSNKTLIGDITGSAGKFASVSSIRNEVGATFGIATFGGSAVYAGLKATAYIGTSASAANSTQLASPTSNAQISIGAAVAMLKDTSKGTQGNFVKMFNKVSSALNMYGNAAKFVDSQISFNKDKIDSLNTGLGYLVDADLSKEAAQLQALQTRQQLGTQSLSIANQAPQSLLSLFRG